MDMTGVRQSALKPLVLGLHIDVPVSDKKEGGRRAHVNNYRPGRGNR